MDRYRKHFVRSADKRIEEFLKHQVRTPERADFGSVRGELVEVKPTVYVLTTAAAVYFNPDSEYYGSEPLYVAMNLAMDFVERCQREDGSFDYPSCNFKSAPDTAFCFKRLIAAYRLLLKYDKDDKMFLLKEKYLRVLLKALHAIAEGGFHTPNHRWAISAALMQGAGLAGESPEARKYMDRAKEYLAEGIDGNDDGEYAERSTGNYNAVVNNAMITMYEESKEEQYLGYVRRNLSMMLTFLDPDDTIFTQNSTRQDQGRSEYADKYFYQYLYMTAHSYNKDFDGAAHKIIRDNQERGELAPDCLHILMLHEELFNYRFREYGFLPAYRKYYREAGVVRVKTDRFGYTLLKHKSAFLFMKVKNTQLYVKIGESYGSIRNFIPEILEVKDGECLLSARAEGLYYKPFKDYQGTSDWWQMDHSKRELISSSEVRLTVTVRELTDGLELALKAEGLDRLPLRVEICVPSGSILENEYFRMKGEQGREMILRSGYVDISHEGNQLVLGPGFGTHSFQGHYSGEEKNDNSFTVFLNEYTPCEKKFTIKVKDQEV